MKIIEILLSLVNKNINLILFWIYNRKVDENIRLQANLKTVKEETEIKSKEEKFFESVSTSENKVLILRKKLETYRGKKK